jgi:hypothetical protein
MLTADGPDTLVELFHHDLPVDERDSHLGGWTTMLGRLARLLRYAGPGADTPK